LIEGYKCHETDIPAEQSKAEAHPRVSCPDEIARWPESSQQTTRERKTSPHRLMPEGRDESFSGKNRLRNSNDFRRVFSRGKRTATPFFILYILPNQLPFPRLGIQVKAKIASAPRRNYLKRIVREVFRRLKNEMRTPIDVILIAQKEMKDLDYHRFETEFRKALGKQLHEPPE